MTMRATTTARFRHLPLSSRWIPEGYDGRTHFAPVMAALIPAVGILAVAASLLLAML
jgi:hypothetical protein